jgi:phosphoserine phosphatase RsbU/P
MLQDALATPGLGVNADLADTAVLLTSELAENAVLHAGTDFEITLDVDDSAVTVAITDRGAGALELHLEHPRRRYGRAATHGRGLLMVARLAASWGTRHERDGRHTTWFSLARTVAEPAGLETADLRTADLALADLETADTGTGHTEQIRSAAEQARRLLNVPTGLSDRLRPLELVGELARRLREALDASGVAVHLDEGDGAGSVEIARAGDPDAGPSQATPLPVTAPLKGVLRIGGSAGGGTGDLVEIIAHRIAMAVETRWLREVDRRRRSWTAYLAETSELLGQSLDVDLAVAVIPQVVVPRLGRWCAVHLVDPAGRMRLDALTHADEDEIPDLRAALDPHARPGLAPELRATLAELVRGAGMPARVAVPTDGLAVPLRTRGRTIGTLLVGRPEGRAHSPEDVVLIGDVARRAALAVQNAQSSAAHVAVSQALQRAVLPRALPVVPGVEFAAEFKPVTTGSEVGGDFYDVLAIDPARWMVCIGDVCGKGARAAARTGLVRDVLRVLVRGGRDLSGALGLLNDVMMEAADPLQYCTLAAATLRRRAGAGLDVELVLAGHPQPVLVRADGTAVQVGAFGTAVGLVRNLEVTPTAHRLAPGDTLLVYTDGVTERRRGREQFGPERLLAAAAAAAGRPARHVVAAVLEAVERFSPGPAGDDVALLAVHAQA